MLHQLLFASSCKDSGAMMLRATRRLGMNAQQSR
jgi:hypothetical protein